MWRWGRPRRHTENGVVLENNSLSGPCCLPVQQVRPERARKTTGHSHTKWLGESWSLQLATASSSNNQPETKLTMPAGPNGGRVIKNHREHSAMRGKVAQWATLSQGHFHIRRTGRQPFGEPLVTLEPGLSGRASCAVQELPTHQVHGITESNCLHVA